MSECVGERIRKEGKTLESQTRVLIQRESGVLAKGKRAWMTMESKHECH